MNLKHRLALMLTMAPSRHNGRNPAKENGMTSSAMPLCKELYFFTLRHLSGVF